MNIKLSLPLKTVGFFSPVLAGVSRIDVGRLGRVFNLHPLILEEVVNVAQRSKVEDREDRLVIITQI